MFGILYNILSPDNKSSCMALGPNLIFQYQFMVWPWVPLRTSEILRIFRMEKVIMYIIHTVVPRSFLRFIPTILGNGQYNYFFSRKSCPLCCKQGNKVLSRELAISIKLFYPLFVPKWVVIWCWSHCWKLVAHVNLLYLSMHHCMHAHLQTEHWAPGV